MKTRIELLNAAELAVSEALTSGNPFEVSNSLQCAEADLVQACLSLARTLVTSAKIVIAGGTVNRAGFVQGSGSRVDTLCAEVAIRRLMKGGA